MCAINNYIGITGITEPVIGGQDVLITCNSLALESVLDLNFYFIPISYMALHK